MTDESVCLDVPDARSVAVPQVRIMACNEYERQQWTYEEEARHLVHLLTERCLDVAGPAHPTALTLNTCDKDKLSQKWIFQHEDWAKALSR